MTFHLAVWTNGERVACDPVDKRKRPRTRNPDAVTCKRCRATFEHRLARAAKRAEAAE